MATREVLEYPHKIMNFKARIELYQENENNMSIDLYDGASKASVANVVTPWGCWGGRGKVLRRNFVTVGWSVQKLWSKRTFVQRQRQRQRTRTSGCRGARTGAIFKLEFRRGAFVRRGSALAKFRRDRAAASMGCLLILRFSLYANDSDLF